MALDGPDRTPGSNWTDQRQNSSSSGSTLSSLHKHLPSAPGRRPTLASAEKGDGRRRQRWLAYSLRPVFLVIVTLLSLLSFAAIEVLRQISNRNQGLAFFTDSDLIPAWIYFLYNFLPPILAVPYAWLWTLLSTDAKRLESYFHLTKPGVPASILFIDYTFGSPLTTPVKAFKRGHWPIVWLGTISLVVSLVFTASQGGLFGLSQVSIQSEVAFNAWTGLISLDAQSTALTANWTNRESVALSSQNVSLPPFVTSLYSMAPFNLSRAVDARNETWTADTDFYWAETDCQPMSLGTLNVKEPDNGTLAEEQNDLLDGYGVKNKLFELELKDLTVRDSTTCNIDVAVQLKAEFAPSGQSNFMPLWDNLTSPLNGSIDGYALGDDQIFRGNAWGAIFGSCPDFDWWGGMLRYTWYDEKPATTPGSLSVYASASTPNYIQLTIVSTTCRATYRTAPGTATILGANGSVIAAEASGPSSELSEDRFQPISFEQTLQSGTDAADPNFENVTYEVPLGSFDVFNGPASVHFPSIVLRNTTQPSELLDASEFSSRVGAAWQLGFAMAFQNAFNTSAAPVAVNGARSTHTISITVTSVFAFLSEALLLICAVASFVTMIFYMRRDNILQSDPDSLAAMCALATDVLTEETIAEFAVEGFDQASTASLKQSLATTRFFPSPDERLRSYHFCESPGEDVKQAGRIRSLGQRPSDRISFFLTIPGWVLSFAFLFLVLGGGIFAFIYSYDQGGFSFLANFDSVTSQLLYSFMPTLVATLVDVCFQQLHRDLGVMESFVRLSNGYQTAADSLTLRYSSRPCFVTLVPAFARKHWFMAFISLTCISTSVLSVVSAALFSQVFTTVARPATFAPAFSASTLPSSWLHTDLDVTQAYEAVQAKLLGSSGQIPWTDERYSYLPVDVESDVGDPTARYTAPTIAIGTSMACQPLPIRPNTTAQDSGVVTALGSAGGFFTNKTAFWSVQPPGQASHIRCSLEWQEVVGQPDNSSFFAAPLTIGGDIHAGADAEDDGTLCARSTLFLLSTIAAANSTGPMDDNAWICTPSLDVRDATLTFGSTGQIAHSAINPTTSDQTKAFFGNQSAFLGEFTNQFGTFSLESIMETTTGSSDWATLLTLDIQNNTLNEGTFATISEQVFSRVFAAWFSIYRDQLLATADSTTRAGSDELRARAAPSSLQGSVATRQARVIPSSPLFVVTIVLLGLYMVAAVVVLVLRRRSVSSPRVPRTLAAILPWVASSRMLRDMEGLHALRSDERERLLQQRGDRFGFGWFVDEHMNWRLGLEREPFVKRSAQEGPGAPMRVINGYYVQSPPDKVDPPREVGK